jgi:peptide/nickel transport system substrate-binding protein
MNWKLLDAVRRTSTPLKNDLIDNYAAGKINRRDFVRRGTIIGLSVPAMTAVLAACGGDDDDAPTASSGDGGGGDAAANFGVVESTGFAAGGVVSVGVQPPSSALDPINMLDQGVYNICSQSFEYLVGVGLDGNITSNALATGWEVNEVGDAWTFSLREGVTWQDGSAFTANDVSATLDRLAEAANAGLGGVIEVGSVDVVDDLTCTVNLLNPNGNFPVLVSNFNAQTLITPVSYGTGTLLDESPNGTGAWIIESYDPQGSAVFTKNPNWWGGETLLDGVEIRHFESTDTAITAVESGSIDAIQQFNVIGGEGLLDDSEFTVLTPPASTHRQVWFNTSQGNFTNKLVRQAMAWTFDRERMVSTLFNGRAEIGNDYPVWSTLPFYDPDAVEQRSRNIEKAKELLAQAEVEALATDIHFGDVQEVPDLAQLIAQDALDAGFDVTAQLNNQGTFYDDSWCPPNEGPTPCADSDDFGIVDWGHRPVPDVFLSSSFQTNAVWNASVYADSDYDALITEYQGSFTVDDQKTAMTKIQQKLWEDVPAIYPYFYNYLSGARTNVANMQSTALGHSMLTQASKEA